MVVIQGVKYACDRCIRGHRVSGCVHADKALTMVKPKGRPTTRCSHCREIHRPKTRSVAASPPLHGNGITKRCTCSGSVDSTSPGSKGHSSKLSKSNFHVESVKQESDRESSQESTMAINREHIPVKEERTEEEQAFVDSHDPFTSSPSGMNSPPTRMSRNSIAGEGGPRLDAYLASSANQGLSAGLSPEIEAEIASSVPILPLNPVATHGYSPVMGPPPLISMPLSVQEFQMQSQGQDPYMRYNGLHYDPLTPPGGYASTDRQQENSSKFNSDFPPLMMGFVASGPSQNNHRGYSGSYGPPSNPGNSGSAGNAGSLGNPGNQGNQPPHHQQPGPLPPPGQHGHNSLLGQYGQLGQANHSGQRSPDHQSATNYSGRNNSIQMGQMGQIGQMGQMGQLSQLSQLAVQTGQSQSQSQSQSQNNIDSSAHNNNLPGIVPYGQLGYAGGPIGQEGGIKSERSASFATMASIPELSRLY